MKKNRRMAREDRKAQIIESAMSLFVQNGYTATTTANIAKEAGISEVTLFRNFSSKEELFMAGLEPILLASLENSINESQDLEPREQLTHILQERIKFASNNHEVVQLILMESQINPEVVGVDYIDKIVMILKESIKETGIEFQDEELSIRLLMGSILSFLYFPEKDEKKIEQYVKNIVTTLTNNFN